MLPDVKQRRCTHPRADSFPITTRPKVIQSLHNNAVSVTSTDLFRNNVSVHLPFHLLQSGCDGGELGRAYRLVQDLLTVPAERQRRYSDNPTGRESLRRAGAPPNGRARERLGTDLSWGILSRDTGSSPSTSANSWCSFSCTASDRDRKCTAQMHTGKRNRRK